ncbi:uncharacterized protein F5147DRAFT_783496, partial [Suillus discolor]
MLPFNPSMLAATPEPETPPSPSGNQQTADAPPAERSLADCVNDAWRGICESMRVCVLTILDAKPELLEEQETWMRQWNTSLEQLNDCYTCAQVIQLELLLSDEDLAALAEGKKGCRALEKLVKGWKAKAVEPVCEKSAVPPSAVVEGSGAAPAPTTRQTEVMDMAACPLLGKNVCVARIAAACVTVRLASAALTASDPSRDVHSLAEPKLKAKPLARVRTALPHGAAPTKKVRTGSMSSARPTIVTTANDVVSSEGESKVEIEVEIVEEKGKKQAEEDTEAEVEEVEEFVRRSTTIPPCPVRPIPKRPVPAPKRKLDLGEREELDALRTE